MSQLKKTQPKKTQLKQLNERKSPPMKHNSKVRTALVLLMVLLLVAWMASAVF